MPEEIPVRKRLVPELLGSDVGFQQQEERE
jgi:hypothetical protein